MIPCNDMSITVIPADVLGVASQSTTATAMARTLLVATFDMTTLLNSNLKGGCSKTADAEDSVHLQKLDPAKLDAIYGQYKGKTAKQTEKLFRNLGTKIRRSANMYMYRALLQMVH